MSKKIRTKKAAPVKLGDETPVKRKLKMNEPISLTIDRSVIVEQIASLLIALKAVPYKREIEDIDIVRIDLTANKIELMVYLEEEKVTLKYF